MKSSSLAVSHRSSGKFRKGKTSESSSLAVSHRSSGYFSGTRRKLSVRAGPVSSANAGRFLLEFPKLRAPDQYPRLTRVKFYKVHKLSTCAGPVSSANTGRIPPKFTNCSRAPDQFPRLTLAESPPNSSNYLRAPDQYPRLTRADFSNFQLFARRTSLLG